MEQTVGVRRGASVDIPLRIYGTRSQTLSWIIRQQPAHGQLSKLRATSPETAVITYTPAADLRFTADTFTFSARSNEGASAPALVSISISDDPAKLVVPDIIDFGTVLTGSISTRQIEFTNGGGGIAEGEIMVDPPWRLDGSRRYKLGAGERHIAKVTFTPERGGRFDSEIRFSSQPERTTALRGLANEPLAVTPSPLELRNDAGTTLRAAGFELRNNTSEPIDVAINASKRLIIPTTLHLDPLTSVAVSVQATAGDAAAISETIRLTAGGISARLQVSAKALPAMIRALPEKVKFRRATAGGAEPETVTFENVGGSPGRMAIKASAPFGASDEAIVLEPGERKAVTVSLANTPTGGVQGTLKVSGDGILRDIALEAEVAPNGEPLFAQPIKRPPPTIQRPGAPSLQPTSIPGPRSGTVTSMTSNRATFEWPGTLGSDVRLRCLRRKLVNGEDDARNQTFSDYARCAFSQRDGRIVATVDNLEPGQVYFFRIDLAGQDGGADIPVSFAQIRTPAPPPSSRRISLLTILVALALATGGAAIWQRSKR